MKMRILGMGLTENPQILISSKPYIIGACEEMRIEDFQKTTKLKGYFLNLLYLIV